MCLKLGYIEHDDYPMDGMWNSIFRQTYQRYLRHVAEEPHRNVPLVLGNAAMLST
jgi:ABC-type hemin transport system ATPase subunit